MGGCSTRSRGSFDFELILIFLSEVIPESSIDIIAKQPSEMESTEINQEYFEILFCFE